MISPTFLIFFVSPPTPFGFFNPPAMSGIYPLVSAAEVLREKETNPDVDKIVAKDVVKTPLLLLFLELLSLLSDIEKSFDIF